MTESASSVGIITGIEPGDVIADKYRIDSVLGAGGMGVVFLARHIQLNGLFALKFLSRESSLNAQALGRFHREAQAAVKLRSDHAVRVFDVGVHNNGLPYIVMEYLEGGDLSRLLRNVGWLPIAQAVDFVLQAGAAIADAHRVGIIHRDIKPSNLFCVAKGEGVMIKVVDFGISKLTDATNEEGVTVTGNFIGSPSYMSPEQMRAANRVDARTDVWSLGVVLYECLTAKLPFPASTYPEICLKVTQDPPVMPSQYRADIPPVLEALILKCLEKDREKRFGSVNELMAALAPFAGSLQPAPARVGMTTALAGAQAKSLLDWLRPSVSGQRTSTSTFTQPSWVRPQLALANKRRPILLGSMVVVAVACVGTAVWLGVRRAQLNSDISAAVPSHGLSAAQAPEPTPDSPKASSSPVVVTPPPALPVPTLVEEPAQAEPAFDSRPEAIVTKPDAKKSVARPVESAQRPPVRPAVKAPTERDMRSPVWTR